MTWTGWTATNTKAFLELVSQGYSTTQIARQLGAPSRNIVAGKAYRMGLKIGSAMRDSNRPGPKPTKRFLKPLVELTQPVGEIKLLNLTSWMCRWPMSQHDAEWTFCAKPADSGPYCAAHARQAFLPAKPHPERLRIG